MFRRLQCQLDKVHIFFKRQVFNYRYLKRNAKIGVAALCIAVVGLVVGVGGIELGSKIAYVAVGEQRVASEATGSDINQKASVSGIEKVATVNASHLMAYEKPDDSSSVLDILAEGNSYSVVSEEGDWVAVTLLSGATGYIPASQVTLSDTVVTE